MHIAQARSEPAQVEPAQRQGDGLSLGGVRGGALAQMQAMVANSPRQTAQRQAMEAIRPNRTGMPDQLKSGIEGLSGMAMDDVKVHYNSDKPAGLNAHAYAQGRDIHVGPGQEKHLPHEAWHVVQQAQGRVQATRQMKEGTAVNDDTGLEREADEMGARAMQLKAAPGQLAALPSVAATMPAQLVASGDLTDQVKAGSPATYRVGDWFVKKWSANQQVRSGAMLALWDAAAQADVPVPSYRQERLTDNNEYVFSIKKCVGSTFFQHSKSGHETNFKTWLSSGHDKHMLERYKGIFAVAKMGDPQAFYENSKNGRIEFMDIQQMTSGGQMGPYIEHIDTLL
jgi:hypothetical protein